MLRFLLFFYLVSFSYACLRTLNTGLTSCQKCNPNIVKCPYGGDSCELCSVTTVSTSPGIGGCLALNVVCGPAVTPAVRMFTETGELVEALKANLGPITCSSNGWMYNGKKIVSLTCTEGLSQQSPINIVSAQATRNPMYNPAAFMYNYNPADAASMVVDSHGWTINFVPAPASSLTEAHLTGEVYRPSNVHMHWVGSPNAEDGSEHSVDGMHHRAEIHMVFFNSRLGSLANALGKRRGVHVVAVFVDIGPSNAEYAKIDAAIKKITNPAGGTVPVADLQMINFNSMLPAQKDFYGYTGSLTTPPYTTCVDFTVLKNPITITAEQLATLTGLSGHVNVRPTQPVTSPIYTS